jgi:hypothetical protein
MTTDIDKALHQQVPSVPAVLKALAVMREELSSKRTYGDNAEFGFIAIIPSTRLFRVASRDGVVIPGGLTTTGR